MIQQIQDGLLVNSINSQVKDLITKIETRGFLSSPRGLAVKALELETLKIDPTFPLLDFSNREFNWRYFMGELSWYLIRDNHVEWINHFSSFWKNLADDASCVNSNYGKLLFGNQLQWAVDSLKRDMHTRQAICFLNRPQFQYEGNKDFVCTMYINFWIRDNELNMKVQMRSNDVFYGLTYDAPFFAFVQQTVWFWLKESVYPQLQLGPYYHCADNIHYYERHFELAKRIVTEENRIPIYFLLHAPLFHIKNENYILTSEGQNFLTDVAQLVNSSEKITQEKSQEVLTKYFYIQ